MRFSASLIAAVSVTLLGINSAEGYGILGHTLTGQIAQRFLTPETARQVKEILSPYYDGLLSKAAPWADTIKGQAKYRWASVYHYVNTPGDDPPNICKCEYVPEGADVVNGILKMTAKLLQFKVVEPTTDEERADREDALKFFVHFLGDVHQPLHASGKDRGGNNARAKWGRAGTSLHRIWDGQLILKDVKDKYNNDPKAYLEDMIGRTKTVWKDQAANWTVCDPSKRIEHPTTDALTTLCPLEWATFMNQLDCTYVWKDYDSSRDYSSDFFDTVTGEGSEFLVQKLMTMSGIRMAAVLNEIYDPPTPLSEGRRYLIERIIHNDETRRECRNTRFVKQG
ncbi:MAG: S1/P1 nuclease [Benniella sp.]|nr:MAG: S1/P1 nuclease [Benniella sp.]